jgi:anti-anti-sigma factor
MTAQGTPASDTAVLRIVGEFTIFRAAELMAALLATPAPREVDLSGVTELDTAGLQLLMLAKKNARAQKQEFHLVAHSPAVIEVFELLNVSAYFGDPLVMDSRAATGDERGANSSAGRGANGS